MEVKKKLPCDIFKNKCRLRGGTAERENYFFSDAGKSLELKRVVFKLCEIIVSESDELPKYCCRSCCEKLTRLNRNIETFASTCKAAQKVLEGDLIASRQSICQKRCRSGNTPTSTEKPRKLPYTLVPASVRKSLSYDQQPNDTSTSLLQEKEASRDLFYIEMLLSATKLNLSVFFLLYRSLNVASSSSQLKSKIPTPVKRSVVHKAPVLLNLKVFNKLNIFEISAGL